MKKYVLTPLIAMSMCASPGLAVPLFWDGDGTGVVGGGAGTWDTTLTRWSPTAGGSTYQAWNNANNDDAVFGGTTGAQIVTIGVPVVANSMTFTVSGYTVTGTSANTLDSSTGTLTVDTQLTAAQTAIFSGFYAPGLATIIKNGAGLYSSSTSQTAFAGKWVVNAGILSVAGDTRLGVVPGAVVPDQVTLNGGFLRSSTATVAFTANRGITLGALGGGFDSANTTLTWAGPITGTAGGSLTKLGVSNLILSNPANNWNGGTTVSGGSLSLGASGVIPDGSVVTLTTAGVSFALNGFDETVKSVAGTAGTIALGGNTLTLNNPAGESYSSVISSTATGRFVKNGTGTLTLSGSSTGFLGEMVLNDGTLGVGGANSLGAGAGGSIFTINGGKLSNTGVSGRTIPATVSVNLNADFEVNDSLAATPGQILFNGPSTIRNSNRIITVNGGANIGFGGVLGEDVPGRQLIKNGTGTLALPNAANTFTGDITINAGRINIDGDGRLGTGANILHLSGGALNVSASRTQPVPNPIDLTADSAITTTSTAATVELDLTSTSIGGSAGTLTFRNEGADAATDIFRPRFSGGDLTLARPVVIDNGATGLTQLRSFNTTGTTQTFSGGISGTGSFQRSASVAGTGGITVFNGSNTYTGATTVADGTLLVNGSLNGTASVSVSGTLGGTGLITTASGGNIDVLLGGELSPGAGIGTLSAALSGGAFLRVVDAVTPTGSLSLNYELDTPASSDRMVTTGGALDIGIGMLELNDFDFSTLGGFGPGDYVLFDGDTAISGTLGPGTSSTVGGYESQLQFADGGNDLVLSVIPEPGSAAFLLGGLGLLAGRRRR